MWIVEEILEKMKRKTPPPEKEAYRPIYQVEDIISFLRLKGTPEHELDKIREKNKCEYKLTAHLKPKKKKKDVEVDFIVPKQKILKPVIKKMYI
jgi:hypothetical protein